VGRYLKHKKEMHGPALAASGGEAAGSGIDVSHYWSYTYDKFTHFMISNVLVLDDIGKINCYQQKI
jgi:hypothetical protein